MHLAEPATPPAQPGPARRPHRPGRPGRPPARRRRRRRRSAFSLPPLPVLARWGWGLLITAAYGLATVVMTWPYAARLDRVVPPHEDPLLQVWIARWVQHTLATDPLHLYDANAFYPLEHTLAYSDSNVPAALLMAPVYLLTGNAILAYNLLVLGTFVLAAGGMYALVGRLTGNRAAGFLAGLAFAFLPYRFAHIVHLNQLGHAWTPWVLLALLRLLERQTWRRALVFGLLLAVQVLTSFNLAFHAALAVGLALLVALVADPRARTRRFAGLLALAGGLAAALVLPLALPYFQVRDQQGLERRLREIEGGEFVARAYLTAGDTNRVWGWLHPARGDENTLFPGGLALAGAVVGLAGWRRRRALTAAALLIGGVAFVLSLGPYWRSGPDPAIPLPYHFLFDHLAVFRSIRAPARFGVLVNLAIVVLAGLGVAWVWQRLAAWAERGARNAERGTGTLEEPEVRSSIPVTPRSALRAPRSVIGAALTLGLAGALLFELHSGPLRLEDVDRRPEVAAPYEWLARQPDAGPVMEFPVRETPRKTTLAMYWSTVHWKPLVQGQSGFVPRLHDSVFEPFVGDLRRLDGTVVREVSYVHDGNVGILQDLGVRYLVFHLEGYKRADWPSVVANLEGTGAAELAGYFGGTVVYRLHPRSAPPPALTLTLAAPSLATPQDYWEPALVVHNPRAQPALLAIKRPLKLTTTWRDERGREVRRHVWPLNLYATVGPGDTLCSIRYCPLGAEFRVSPTMLARDLGREPLTPAAPGRYTVELALTGELTATRTLAVEVAPAPPPAAQDGPEIELAATPAIARAPDGAVTFALDWLVRRQPDGEYTLSARLVGEDGQVWGQRNAALGWPTHTTASWLPGEQVSLPWRVLLKPEALRGNYRLHLAVYRQTPTGPEPVSVRWPDGDAVEYAVVSSQ